MSSTKPRITPIPQNSSSIRERHRLPGGRISWACDAFALLQSDCQDSYYSEGYDDIGTKDEYHEEYLSEVIAKEPKNKRSREILEFSGRGQHHKQTDVFNLTLPNNRGLNDKIYKIKDKWSRKILKPKKEAVLDVDCDCPSESYNKKKPFEYRKNARKIAALSDMDFLNDHSRTRPKLFSGAGHPLRFSSPIINNSDSLSTFSGARNSVPSYSSASRTNHSQQRPVDVSKISDQRPNEMFLCLDRRNDIFGGSGAGINAFTICNRRWGETETSEQKITEKRSKNKRVSKICYDNSNFPGSPHSRTQFAQNPKKIRATAYSTSCKTFAKKGRVMKRSKLFVKSLWKAAPGNKIARRSRVTSRKKSTMGACKRGSSDLYMSIAEQEPNLKGIGGASITF